MSIVILSLVAFSVAVLTFFSGFGLGTLLTPVMMLFFPTEVAIALTGVVHFTNNIYKLTLVGSHINKNVLWQFGIPAVLFAFLGAILLLQITHVEPLITYHFLKKSFEIVPVNLSIGIVLITFAVLELSPRFKDLNIDKKYLPLGGALSGFFGGLSGNQGALRSAFLLKANLTKEAFIATGVAVSAFIDFTRLGVYASRLQQIPWRENMVLIVTATLSAFVGTYIGNRLFKKITHTTLQQFVAIFLIFISFGIALGWF